MTGVIPSGPVPYDRLTHPRPDPFGMQAAIELYQRVWNGFCRARSSYRFDPAQWHWRLTYHDWRLLVTHLPADTEPGTPASGFDKLFGIDVELIDSTEDAELAMRL